MEVHYLGASCSGKERDKNNFDFASDIVYHYIFTKSISKKSIIYLTKTFCEAKVVKELREIKYLELGAENVAAFIAEPILASGGVIVPPKGYHKKTSRNMSENMMLFIFLMKWLLHLAD